MSALIATLVTGGIVLGAVPAHAAAPNLPADQNMFVIDSFRGSYLWSVDPETGASNPIGSSHPTHYMNLNGQQNPVDGEVYFIWTGMVTKLTRVDLETGEFVDIAVLNGDSTYLVNLMITNSGDAFGFDPILGALVGVDLTNGQTTEIGLTGDVGVAMAYNPVDDNIYSYTWDGIAYRIDTTDGSATAVPAHDLQLNTDFFCHGEGMPRDFDIWGAAFDSNGNPWFVDSGCSGSIFVADFATGEMWSQGFFHDDTQAVASAPNYELPSSGNILLTSSDAGTPGTGGGVEGLAETGSDASWMVGSLTVGAIVLAVAAVLRRRRA